MKIHLKIIIPSGILLVILIGFAVYLQITFQAEEQLLAETAIKIEELDFFSNRLKQLNKREAVNLLSYQFSQNQTYLETLSRIDRETETILIDFNQTITSSRGKLLLDQFVNSKAGMDEIRDDLIQAIQAQDEEAINSAFTRWNLKSQNVAATLEDLINLNTKAFGLALIEVEQARTQFRVIVFSTIGFAFLFVVLSAVYYYQNIINPIIALTQAASRIAKGDLEAQLAATHRNDELGVLSHALQKMAFTLIWDNQALDQRVAIRTQELAQMNADLEVEINERRRAETALRVSKTHYQRAFDNSPVPLWEEDFSELYAYLALCSRPGIV